MSNAEILLATIQLSRLASDLIREYQAGQLSEAQVAERWAAITQRVQTADAAWLAAGAR